MRLSSRLCLRAALAALVTLISGPAAGPFGVPARNAAELTAEMLNAGTVPAPHTQKGFGGRPIELVIIDENGGPQKQVAEFRNLAPRVDIVIGYISSGDCLAIAPVAEELKKLTILFELFGGRTLRFSELERAIPGVTQKMLIQQLRDLERDGIVRRVVHPVVPPKVERSPEAYSPMFDLARMIAPAWRSRATTSASRGGRSLA